MDCSQEKKHNRLHDGVYFRDDVDVIPLKKRIRSDSITSTSEHNSLIHDDIGLEELEEPLALPCESEDPIQLPVNHILSRPAPSADEVFARDDNVDPETTITEINPVDHVVESTICTTDGIAFSDDGTTILAAVTPQERPRNEQYLGDHSPISRSNPPIARVRSGATEMPQLENTAGEAGPKIGEKVKAHAQRTFPCLSMTALSTPSCNMTFGHRLGIQNLLTGMVVPSLMQGPNQQSPSVNPFFMYPAMFPLAQPPLVPTQVDHRGIMLSLSCDREQLSGKYPRLIDSCPFLYLTIVHLEYQVLIRQQLEIFQAGAEDVDSNTQGRKKQLFLGQVGLRCRHCALLPVKARGRGAVYYPMKLQSIYQAGQNMAWSHLCEACEQIPNDVKVNIRQLKERRDNANGGKQYWADGCRALGVYETEQGLRLQATPRRNHVLFS